MGNKFIRLLRADEIECRTGIIRENGLSLLLYKDARVDQNILDEVFGTFGWKREHQILDGKMFCTISIRDENGDWIPKQDVGSESYSEPVKGAASDSFKRAAFNIGIGRELYTAPFIWIPADAARIEKRGDRYITKDSFHVSEIRYEPEIRAIRGLRICNQSRLVVYEIGIEAEDKKKTGDRYGNYQETTAKNGTLKSRSPKSKSKKRTITQAQINELVRELERTGVSKFRVLQRYGLSSLESMDEETFLKALAGLQKTPTAA